MLAPSDEKRRVAALQRYRILDSVREQTFDQITNLAASILDVNHACVSLVDTHRVWFKSSVGLDAAEVDRVPGLCDTVVERGEARHLEDAVVDPIASDNPLVSAEEGIRFYTGIPLMTPDGFAIGALCAFHPSPRPISAREVNWMEMLAEFTMQEIEARRVRLELESTEGALLQAQRLGSIGLVASGVAHDFNNMLSAIQGNVGLLQQDLPQDSASRALVDEIDSVTRRATELVGQVLAYAGRDQNEKAVAVDLNQLVAQTTYLLESVMRENTQLDFVPAPAAAVVDGHPASLRQLIMNLVTNASESYGGKQGRVRLALHVGDDVQLVVSDEGIGLTEGERQRMFEPFFTTKIQGRGLGLSVVKRIADGLRAQIHVESQRGAGTTIRVQLPQSSQPAREQPAATHSTPTGANGGTILVVDDERPILTLARRILERSHFEVLCADTGEEAVELLERNHERVTLAVLDLSMPGMTGTETLLQLRNISPELRIVLSSGHTPERIQESIVADAIDGLLKKPYGPPELLAAVQAALATSAND